MRRRFWPSSRGIDVIADFRSRDVAAGGQGAPLVPAFHRAIFGRAGATVAVLNLGGIANLTVLEPAREAIGFDCGPANTLLDLWCERSSGRAFDAERRRRLPAAPSMRGFSTPCSPSRTSRWRRRRARGSIFSTRHGSTPASTRPMRALGCAPRTCRQRSRELTADVVAASCRRHAAAADELVVCGGGAFNADLMARLGRALAPMAVVASDARGLPADQVEATRVRLAGARLRRAAGRATCRPRPAPPVRGSSVRSTRLAERRKPPGPAAAYRSDAKKKPPDGGFLSA